jgi:hypothetical protein
MPVQSTTASAPGATFINPVTNDMLTVFNGLCYQARYPDLKKWIGTPLEHWQQYGQQEGRIPGCDPPGTIYSDQFNAECYLENYPDVAHNWFDSPLQHWIQHGMSEGRHPGCRILPPGAVAIQGSNTPQTANPSQTPSTGIPVIPYTDPNAIPIDTTVTPDLPPTTSTGMGSSGTLILIVAAAVVLLGDKISPSNKTRQPAKKSTNA